MNSKHYSQKLEEKEELKASLTSLQSTLAKFIEFYQGQRDFSILVNTSWSAKDILGHLTFWHESFARNISSLGNKRKPVVLKGRLSEVMN